jgi:hypothetical protein
MNETSGGASWDIWVDAEIMVAKPHPDKVFYGSICDNGKTHKPIKI